MNERIRELADEAAKFSAIMALPTGEAGDTLFVEKFAEFIVRECMDIISDESEKVSDEWRCKDGKHIWWKIKEHFGVVE